MVWSITSDSVPVLHALELECDINDVYLTLIYTLDVQGHSYVFKHFNTPTLSGLDILQPVCFNVDVPNFMTV